MKKDDTHPQYHDDAVIVCSCGNKIKVGSTKKEQQTELCSKCHPFYTGTQKLVDTAGRVDKFKKKQEEAAKKREEAKKKPAKKRKKTMEEKFNEEIAKQLKDEMEKEGK